MLSQFSGRGLPPEGPIVPIEMQLSSSIPAASGTVFGYKSLPGRGPFMLCARNKLTVNGYMPQDMIQLSPTPSNLVNATNNGQSSFNSGKFTHFNSQGKRLVPKAGGASVSIDSSTNYSMVMRALIAPSTGPHLPPQGKGILVAGRSEDFSMPAINSQLMVDNQLGLEPFMWTLYARCITADMTYAIGDEIVVIPQGGAGGENGWGISVDWATKRFVISTTGNLSLSFTDSSGTANTLTASRWVFYFRFVAIDVERPRHKMTSQDFGEPLRIYRSESFQVTAPLVKRVPLPKRRPVLAFIMMDCIAPDAGITSTLPGDWSMFPEGTQAATLVGCSLSLRNNHMILASTGTLRKPSTVVIDTNAWRFFAITVC